MRIMQNSPNQIQPLLNSYRKSIDKTIQRSALLQRNKLFLSELNGFKKRVGETFFKVKDLSTSITDEEKRDNPLIVLDYPKEDFSDNWKQGDKGEPKMDRYWSDLLNHDRATYNPPKNIREQLLNKREILRSYIRKWEELCERWHIESEWGGNLANLDSYARQNVEIYRDWDHNIQKESILIGINEWTTLEDIKSKWAEIEAFQNEFWGKRERRPNFARDLIWHDLSTIHKLSPSKIAAIWNEKFPQDIDLLVLRRFRPEIDSKDLGGKVWDDAELIKEIKNGQLKIKYEKLFLDEHDFYLTGKIKKGSRTVSTSVPFFDVIKKAVKRMGVQINQASMPPLPDKRSFIGFPPHRIG